ncbi:MAG: methyltransferase domain-containing protein [Acidobacteriia bacterium]|nr:methyltransferase domain-containing protein [Terriglobia bacterium]
MKIRLIGLVLLLGVGFNQAPAQDACQEFSTWYRTHRSVSASDLATAYRSELISRGLNAAEADKRFAELVAAVGSCRQLAELNFNTIYGLEKMPFRTEPNAFLVASTKDVKPGRALDVAMGQGRNSIYLAKTGWEVTGFDISSKGLAAARAAAELAGVKIQTVLQGWQDFDFGAEKWDLIVMSYAWVPIDDRAFVNRLLTGLRPAGLLVFEHYLDESGEVPGGPKPNELLRLFGSDLRILRYEDIETVSDWKNQSKARVARLLARK